MREKAMTTRHTPGPWYYHRQSAPNLYAEDGTEIGGANFVDDGLLIAAAPDLLEMLEEMAAQHYCGCRHPACKRCKDDDACAAAIAKAKGETT